jgi:hypothetical protein
VSDKKFTVYYFHDYGPDAIFAPSVLENWGVFDAEDAATAIEMALADQYPDASNNVVPLFDVSRHGRSKESDRRYLNAVEETLSSRVVSEEIKQLWLETAREEFFTTVGPDLREKCQFGTNGFEVNGEISPDERTIITQAYKHYLKRVDPDRPHVQVRLV